MILSEGMINSLIEQLNRIELMVSTLVDDNTRRKVLDDKLKMYQFQISVYEKMLEESESELNGTNL